MRQARLSGLIPKRRGRTTIRVPAVRTAPDLVERDFAPTAPDRLWCSDITYVRTWEGWLYLAAVARPGAVGGCPTGLRGGRTRPSPVVRTLAGSQARPASRAEHGCPAHRGALPMSATLIAEPPASHAPPQPTRRQAPQAAERALYGIGELCAVTILSELGDVGRFDNSRDAVRYGGMDITVYQSDRHRSRGHLSRQGPPALRWALYEAAQAARRPGSPDRDYYLQAAERLGGNRACLALARKLLKRC